MNEWMRAPPSVERDFPLLVKLINSSKIKRDDVLDLVGEYTKMYDKAVMYQSMYITERRNREKLEAENAFLTDLINRYDSDE